jgi:hypothetical protein
MRGPLEGVSALLAPTLFSFQQAREDLASFTEGLTTDQMWARPFGLAPVGFHIRHIGRSVERLTTYMLDRPLDAAQSVALGTELEAGESRKELLAEMERHLTWASVEIRNTPETRLREPRGVGRKRLPTTVIGLIVHIAEHTQRHVGQAIVTAKIFRQDPARAL